MERFLSGDTAASARVFVCVCNNDPVAAFVCLLVGWLRSLFVSHIPSTLVVGGALCSSHMHVPSDRCFESAASVFGGGGGGGGGRGGAHRAEHLSVCAGGHIAHSRPRGRSKEGHHWMFALEPEAAAV
jgi:hypothetical protein